MGENEIKYVQEAFELNWISPVGPHIERFERSLEAYTGASHAVALSSGTAAIHLSLIMLGVKPGDYVICQSFTFAGSAFPIKYVGAHPVFVDSETDTWNMDSILLEESISQIHRSTNSLPKAIIPVHLYGMPAKMNEIKQIADKYGIPIIEDAAEALGSSYAGKKCGSLSEISVLSFNGNKIITSSGGGAFLTENSEWAEKAKKLSTQARDQAPHYQHSEIGFNYRLSNISAAIGLGQMEVLQERVQRRIEIWEKYYEALQEDLQFQNPKSPTPSIHSNRWLTCVLFPDFDSKEKVRLALEKENIESRPLWKPMHLQPVFEKETSVLNGVSEDLFNRGLCLPSWSKMEDGDLERVIDIVKSSNRGIG